MELQLFVLHFRYYGPLFVILIGLVITYLYIVYSLYRKVSFQTSKIFENEEYIVLMCINCLSSTCNTGISLPGVSEVMGSTLCQVYSKTFIFKNRLYRSENKIWSGSESERYFEVVWHFFVRTFMMWPSILKVWIIVLY